MDDCTLQVALLTAAVVAFLAGLLFYLINSGTFVFKPEVWQGTPPIRNVTIMYKSGTGHYKNCSAIFHEVDKLLPDSECIGLYYDNPDEVPADDLRWAVGVILAEGVEKVDKNEQKMLETAGFRLKTLPSVDLAVLAKWDLPNFNLAFVLFLRRVYPAMMNYLTANKLESDAKVCVEIYEHGNVTVVFPLDHQEAFIVPEFDKKK